MIFDSVFDIKLMFEVYFDNGFVLGILWIVLFKNHFFFKLSVLYELVYESDHSIYKQSYINAVYLSSMVAEKYTNQRKAIEITKPECILDILYPFHTVNKMDGEHGSWTQSNV